MAGILRTVCLTHLRLCCAGPYANNQEKYESLKLPAGSHSFYYNDQYDDGWEGGWWEVKDKCGVVLAGGPAAGLVTATGGEAVFTVAADADTTCPTPTGRPTSAPTPWATSAPTSEVLVDQYILTPYLELHRILPDLAPVLERAIVSIPYGSYPLNTCYGHR